MSVYYSSEFFGLAIIFGMVVVGYFFCLMVSFAEEAELRRYKEFVRQRKLSQNFEDWKKERVKSRRFNWMMIRENS